MIKHQRILIWGIGIAALAILAGVALAFTFRDQLVAQKDVLEAIASIATILGALALIIALLEYISSERGRRQARNFETVKMTMEFMSRFYDTPELEEIRTLIRNNTPYSRPPSGIPGYASLRDDEVRVMNFFETIAIAVEEGCLDIAVLDKMLGSPITEIETHKTMKELLKPKYHYEGFTQVLLPAIKELRAKRAG